MIGSRIWMKTSNGKLSTGEKIKLINRTLIPSVFAYSKTFFQPYNRSNQLNLQDYLVPDTPIVQEVISELNQCSSVEIIQHSWRCYFWGIAVANTKNWQFDHESYLIASLMHNVGLADPQANFSCQCFTLESALRSEAICQKNSYEIEKTQNISDAICLHMNGYLDEHDSNISKESLLLQKATSFDVIGSELNLFNYSFVKQVLKKYPRDNFKNEMKSLIKKECLKNPYSRTALFKTLGLPTMITLSRHELKG